MKLAQIAAWLDRELELSKFDDVSNNGLQIAREGDDVKVVAFAVDGSVASVKAAAAAGAQLLVVHHGISWGGGIRRLTDGAYNVVKAAMDANLALYGVHLPLDASKKYGNNWEIARFLKLTNVRPAFNYHGNVIGVIGTSTRNATVTLGTQTIKQSKNQTIGICSGGAGDFGAEAKLLGCDLYVTGEASWGDVIAAENVGANMVCCGHYETETFGVKALAKALARSHKIKTKFIDRI
ncbi:MAG: Nif3-like dinuclear metal center hexameric protein [Kiritimatiellia bacterium]|nr:Nif3-like dinuclear metal center hexameric protein [Kiritimatiellia bacterium]